MAAITDVIATELQQSLLPSVIPMFENTTFNTTGYTNETEHFYEFYQAEQIIFLCVLFIFILIGNISVLVAIFISKNRKTRMNFFIMHLAIADLSTGLIVVLTEIIWKATVAWYAGNVGCKIVRFFQSMATYGSTYVLVALSIDRLDAIARPMSFSGSGFRSKVLIATAWGLAVLFSIPMLIINGEEVVMGLIQCWILFDEHWHWKLYITSHALLVFIIPTVIIACCYSIIVLIIWSKNPTEDRPKPIKRFTSLTSRKRNGNTTKSAAGLISNGGTPTHHQQNTIYTTSGGLIPKARVKTIKMTFVIVLVFIVCWSPYFVFDLLDVYTQIRRTQKIHGIAIFIQSLAPLNSAANPVIYCLFSTKICTNWRHLSVVEWITKKLNCCNNSDRKQPTQMTYLLEYTVTEPRLHSSPKVKSRSSPHVINGESPQDSSSSPFIRAVVMPKENTIIMQNLQGKKRKMDKNKAEKLDFV